MTIFLWVMLIIAGIAFASAGRRCATLRQSGRLRVGDPFATGGTFLSPLTPAPSASIRISNNRPRVVLAGYVT